MALNKTDLVTKIAASTGESQAAVGRVLDGFFAALEGAVKAGEKVTIPGWRAVEKAPRAARAGRNPPTGAGIKVPAGFGVKVSAGSKLKAAAK